MKNKNKIFTSLAVLGSAIFAMVLTAGTGIFEAFGIFNRTTTGNSGNYNIVLDKNNAYSSGASKDILTSSGKNPITFSYSGCDTLNNGHAVLNENGTIGNNWTNKSDTFNNKLSSITSITPVFTASAGASLQFRASYNGKSSGAWGDFAPLTSEESFNLTSNPYYIEFKAVGGSINLTSCKIDYLCNENPSAIGTPLYETSVNINNGETKTYSINDTFNDLIEASKGKGLSSFDVVKIMSNGENVNLKRGDFDYTVTNSSGTTINTANKFGVVGKYTAHIKVGSLPQFDYVFNVSAIQISRIDITSSLNINVNEEQTISATITPENADNKTLSWSVDDSSVVSIDNNGKIKGLKVGNTKVRASSTDGSTIVSNDCNIKVSAVAVESITLSKYSLTLKSNASETITATVYPENATDKSLVWSSDNPSVASVSSGTITAHAEGPATITASAHNGVSVDCTVTVSDDEPVDPNMKIAYEAAEQLKTGSSSYSQYSFSGIVVGTRTSGSYKDIYVQSGDYGLDLYNSGKSADYKDKVEVKSYLKNYSGTLETDVVTSFTNKGQVKLPNAKQITSATELADTKQNTLVDFSGIVKSIVEGSSGSISQGTTDITITATAPNGGDVVVFIKKNSYNAKISTIQSISVGETINISNGIRGIFTNSSGTTNQVLVVNETTLSKTVKHVESVSVTPETANIKVGKTAQLSATVLPLDANNKKVTWTSGDSTVASVSENGLVTGIKAGSSVITAKTDDGNFTDTCTVTVSTVAVTGISLAPTSAEIFENETKQFTASLTPTDATNQGVTFTSGNTSIATVDDNGLVTGTGVGSTTIKATSVDGHFEATSSITVKATPVVLQSITVSEEHRVFNIGNDFVKETVTANYSNGTKVNVTSSATFNGYDMSKKGTQTVYVYYTDGDVTKDTSYTISVKSSGGDTPVGNQYQIVFSKESSDGTIEIDSTGIRNEIASGNSYVSTISSYSKIFSGTEGLKFGSGKQNGYLEFTTSSVISDNQVTGIIIDSTKYGNDTGSFQIYINDGEEPLFTVTPGDDDTETYVFDTPTVVTTFYIKTTSVRAYLGGITFVCQPPVPTNPESITLSPSTLTLGLNQTSDKITVKYNPTNANQNLGVTWSSSNTNVATVNNGVVTAKSVAGTAIITATGYGGITATCSVTVNDIKVTSVTVNPSSHEMSIGDTVDLTTTVKPDNASNKQVTWTTSDSSVASVSTSGKVTANKAGTATITATAKDGSGKSGTCYVTVTEQQMDKWTIMIYMCGSNLESGGSGQASGDIREILATANQPDDVNIIIETGGSNDWSLSGSYIGDSDINSISGSNISRWHVKNHVIYSDNISNNANMGLSSTYRSFLDWGLSYYPAQKTGVVLWNHGGGLDGVCFDENYDDDALENSEMKSAHSSAIGSNKLDFIGYDACLMQCADIADFNSNYFDYQVASQESENGSGWYYTGWIDNVYANNSVTTVCKEIVDEFIRTQGTSSDQTLSYLDLSYASQFKTAWNSYASALNTKFKSSSVKKSDFASWAKKSIRNYAEQGYCGYGQFDIKDWMNKCQAQTKYQVDTSYITAVNNVLSSLIAYNKTGSKAGNSYGLSCVYCCSSQVYYGSGEYAYSNWATFNNSYGL